MRFCALSVLALVLSSPSFASGGGEGHGSAHGASGGLPQFDFSTWPSQIFWLSIVFGILYVTFSKRVLPEISGILTERREHIRSDLDTAERLRQEAQKVQESYESGLSGAREQASVIFAALAEDIARDSAEADHAFRERFDHEVGQASERLERFTQEISGDLKNVSVELACAAIEKISGVQADPQDVRQSVERAGIRNGSSNRSEAA